MVDERCRADGLGAGLRPDAQKALLEKGNNMNVLAPGSGDPDSRMRLLDYIPFETKLDLVPF